MKILVTGATGNVGRLVVDELLALGADDVRALTNDPARAALPPGVEVAEGYLGRPETLPAALAGVDRMYLAPLIRTNAEVCRMAADAGVRHIVDLAGAKGDHWQVIEDGVEASGVPWTHLEPGEFMHNAHLWAAQIAAGDVVRDTCGDAANAPIDIADIAAVAARILVDGGHVGRSYELTGPESPHPARAGAADRRGSRPCADLRRSAPRRGDRGAGEGDGGVRRVVRRRARDAGPAPPAGRRDGGRAARSPGHDVRPVGGAGGRHVPVTG